MNKKSFSVTEHFKKLRDRAGYSMDELAKAAGYSGASSIQRYENAHDYKKDFFNSDLASKLAKALVGKGEPPITENDVWALALPDARERLLNGETKLRVVSSYDPDERDHDNDETLTYGSQTGFKGAPEGSSPQIDITGGMGAGGLAIISEGVPGRHGMTFSADQVSDYWRLPSSVLIALGLAADDAAIVPVQGDSMYPTLEEGDFVVLDTRHRWPSPDGIYGILDDFGGLIIKRLEVFDEDGDQHIRIISDNAKHRVREKKAGEVYIVGRVLRRFGVIK